jgi:hypothetical protein
MLLRNTEGPDDGIFDLATIETTVPTLIGMTFTADISSLYKGVHSPNSSRTTTKGLSFYHELHQLGLRLL